MSSTKPSPSDKVPNRPTPEGRELGTQLARFCDAADAELRQHFPKAAERCASCAFRAGTVPNGCEMTLMDALKCLNENVPFMCHEVPHDTEPVRLCAGYAALMTPGRAVTMPWPFSDEPSHD